MLKRTRQFIAIVVCCGLINETAPAIVFYTPRFSSAGTEQLMSTQALELTLTHNPGPMDHGATWHQMELEKGQLPSPSWRSRDDVRPIVTLIILWVLAVTFRHGLAAYPIAFAFVGIVKLAFKKSDPAWPAIQELKKNPEQSRHIFFPGARFKDLASGELLLELPTMTTLRKRMKKFAGFTVRDLKSMNYSTRLFNGMAVVLRRMFEGGVEPVADPKGAHGDNVLDQFGNSQLVRFQAPRALRKNQEEEQIHRVATIWLQQFANGLDALRRGPKPGMTVVLLQQFVQSLAGHRINAKMPKIEREPVQTDLALRKAPEKSGKPRRVPGRWEGSERLIGDMTDRGLKVKAIADLAAQQALTGDPEDQAESIENFRAAFEMARGNFDRPESEMSVLIYLYTQEILAGNLEEAAKAWKAASQLRSSPELWYMWNQLCAQLAIDKESSGDIDTAAKLWGKILPNSKPLQLVEAASNLARLVTIEPRLASAYHADYWALATNQLRLMDSGMDRKNQILAIRGWAILARNHELTARRTAHAAGAAHHGLAQIYFAKAALRARELPLEARPANYLIFVIQQQNAAGLMADAWYEATEKRALDKREPRLFDDGTRIRLCLEIAMSYIDNYTSSTNRKPSEKNLSNARKILSALGSTENVGNAWYKLAKAYRQAGKEIEAQEAWNKARTHFEKTPPGFRGSVKEYTQLAVDFFESGDKEYGVTLMESAQQVAGGEAYSDIAKAWALMGKWRPAQSQIKLSEKPDEIRWFISTRRAMESAAKKPRKKTVTFPSTPDPVVANPAPMVAPPVEVIRVKEIQMDQIEDFAAHAIRAVRAQMGKQKMTSSVYLGFKPQNDRQRIYIAFGDPAVSPDDARQFKEAFVARLVRWFKIEFRELSAELLGPSAPKEWIEHALRTHGNVYEVTPTRILLRSRKILEASA